MTIRTNNTNPIVKYLFVLDSSIISSLKFFEAFVILDALNRNPIHCTA